MVGMRCDRRRREEGGGVTEENKGVGWDGDRRRGVCDRR